MVRGRRFFKYQVSIQFVCNGSEYSYYPAELEIEWHQVRICMAEMIHFVRQMQTYCHLDVIELSWKELLEFCNKKEGDLDALIGAHRRHVERVMHKILLTTTNPKPKKELQYDSLLNCMKELFHMILQFREAMVC